MFPSPDAIKMSGNALGVSRGRASDSKTSALMDDGLGQNFRNFLTYLVYTPFIYYFISGFVYLIIRKLSFLLLSESSQKSLGIKFFVFPMRRGWLP